MLRLVNDIKSVSKRKPKTGGGYVYVSDFSSGVDNWEEVAGVLSIEGSQSIGGENDALLVTCEVAGGKAVRTSIRNLSSLSTGDIVSGNDYEVKFAFYIPSANDEVLYIDEINLGGVNTTVDTGPVAKDTWLARTVTFTAASTAVGFSIKMNEDHESGAEDQFYLKNISIREL